jgi:predicted dehydrogenase
MDSHINIIVAGAGQIGSRHLQSLAALKIPLHLCVIEPSPQSRATAAERLAQVMPAGSNISVSYCETPAQMTITEADVAIVATNADVRPAIVKEITSRAKIRFIILEKVVYQSLGIFREQMAWLEEKGVKVWVNCPRRMYPFYRDLKESLSAEGEINIMVSGTGWGLGCNALHFIDLFAFLTGVPECSVNYSAFGDRLLESKRAGYTEFTGHTAFSNSRGWLHLSSSAEGALPVQIEIASQSGRIIINESARRVITIPIRTSEPVITSNHFPMQSELTSRVVMDLLDSGSCDLTPLSESYKHHSVLLPLLNDHIARVRGSHTDICPVT